MNALISPGRFSTARVLYISYHHQVRMSDRTRVRICHGVRIRLFEVFERHLRCIVLYLYYDASTGDFRPCVWAT